MPWLPFEAFEDPQVRGCYQFVRPSTEWFKAFGSSLVKGLRVMYNHCCAAGACNFFRYLPYDWRPGGHLQVPPAVWQLVVPSGNPAL